MSDEELKTPQQWRGLAIFDNAKYNAKATIVGVGATGGWIAIALVNMGITDITVYDFDKVERHNLPNQPYGMEEVGEFKVDALKKIIKRDTGITITAKNEKVDGYTPLEGIVFLCTDTMSSRVDIWQNAIKYRMKIPLLIETRMGAEIGYIYTVRPGDPRDVKGYEKTYKYDDGRDITDESLEEPVCTYRAIIPNILIIAGLSAQKVIQYYNNKKLEQVTKIEEGSGKGNASRETFCLNPILLRTSSFENR